MELKGRIRAAIASSCLIILLGTSGYHLLEGWDFLDSLYMTVITLTTVGFGEVHPLVSVEGRVFTILLILSGMGVMFYCLGTLAQVLVEGQIRDLLDRKKMKKAIHSLRDHCIVCGFGRIGQSIAFELDKAKAPFVVIERSQENIRRLQEKGYLCVEGDATSEEILLEAGIKRARAVISVASTDADNLYITLTAKSLNPQVKVIARAAEQGAERKLLWAGADQVVSPYRMSGQRMANLLLGPNVVEFIESSLTDANVELVMEEVHLPEGSPFVGKDLVSSGLRRDYGLMIVAIKRRAGELIVNPSPEEVLRGGDVLIAVGRRSQFSVLSERLVGLEGH